MSIKFPFRRCLTGITPFWVAMLLVLPRMAQAQANNPTDCHSVVPFAEDLFFNAKFGDAIEALQECLKTEVLVDAQRAAIYLLLAKVYFADQKKAPAAEALEAMFALRPDYKPEPYLPPPFIEFAEHIREIHGAEEVVDKHLMLLPVVSEEKKNNNKRWLLIGGGGLFAVTAVAIMSGGRSHTPDVFPPAPGPPSGQ